MEAADSDYKRVLELMCERGDWMTALRAASDAGAPKCKWLLGACYAWGIIVRGNQIMAKELLTSAHIAGCKRSTAELFAMGTVVGTGGVFIDSEDALAHGDSHTKGVVCYWRGNLDYHQHFKDQIEADEDPMACCVYGGICVKDAQKEYGIGLLLRAANAGFAPAQYEYWLAIGGAIDYASVDLDYLYRAAYQGFDHAINKLWHALYDRGRFLAAYNWYEIRVKTSSWMYAASIGVEHETTFAGIKRCLEIVTIVLRGRWYDPECLLRGLPKDVVRLICKLVLGV